MCASEVRRLPRMSSGSATLRRALGVMQIATMKQNPSQNRLRSLVVIAATGVLLASGLILQSWPAAAAERADAPEEIVTARPLPLDLADEPELPGVAIEADAPAALPKPDRATEFEPESGNSDSWIGSGTIRGLIRIPEALRARVERVTVVAEEAVNRDGIAVQPKPQIQRRMLSVEFMPGKNEAYFEITDVPFSNYGWQVAPRVPRLNGSESYVVLRPEQPDASVQLEIHPGIPVSITIRDQHRHPVEGIPLELRPVGRPLGRSVQRGKTDAYGLLVLADVLAGDYDMHVGSAQEPLTSPKRVEIPNKGHHYENIELPRGARFAVTLVGPVGLGLEDVQLDLIAVDSKVYRKYTAKSDKLGNVELPHVPPGQYYAHFTKKGFERLFKQVQILQGNNPELRFLMKRDR